MKLIDPTRINLIVKASDVKIHWFAILAWILSIFAGLYVFWGSHTGNPEITINTQQFYLQFPLPFNVPRFTILMCSGLIIFLLFCFSKIFDETIFIVFRKTLWWRLTENNTKLVPANRVNFENIDYLIRIRPGRNQYVIQLPNSGKTIEFEIEIKQVGDEQAALSVLQWLEGFQHDLKENRIDEITEARIINKLTSTVTDANQPVSFKILNQP